MGNATRLNDVRRIVEEQLAKPYVYGSADCFFMTLAIVDGLTGSNHTEKHMWSYRTFPQAGRALRKAGYETLTEYFEDRLPRIATMRCEPGDVAVVRLGNMEHTAVCLGARFVTKTGAGRLDVSADRVISAFKV